MRFALIRIQSTHLGARRTYTAQSLWKPICVDFVRLGWWPFVMKNQLALPWKFQLIKTPIYIDICVWKQRYRVSFIINGSDTEMKLYNYQKCIELSEKLMVYFRVYISHVKNILFQIGLFNIKIQI